MRYAVLILAILGMIASGGIAYIWYDQANDLQKMLGKGTHIEEIDKLRMASYGLAGAAVLGVVGGYFAMNRQKYIAAPLLLLPSAAPVYFSLSVEGALLRVLVGCGPLLLAGLLSFAIRPKPKTASAKEEAAEEEEEQPPRGGKKPSVEVKNVAKKPEKKTAHAATDEEAEAAFAALEMEGAEAEAAAAEHGTSPEAEDIDLEAAAPEEEEPEAAEAAVAEEEEQVDLEAAAQEEERVDLETAATSDEDQRVDLESAAAPFEEPAEPPAEDLGAVYEEGEAAAPEWIDRFVCPFCDTYLKSSAPLPVGKPFNCPKCHEPVAVTARV